MGSWWIGLLACTDPPPLSPPHVDSEPGLPTADTAPTEILSVDCTLDVDNVLRASCTILVDPPRGITLSVAPSDGSSPAIDHDRPEASEHVVPLIFLTAETAYTWTVDEATGTFTTGVLPLGAQTVLTVSGNASVPWVGMASACPDGAYATINDTTTGQVVWYQNLAPLTGQGFVEAVSFTEDRTVVGLVSGQLAEFDLQGRLVLELLPNRDLEHRVHHDVFRRDGLTYVLFQETVTIDRQAWILDGFYVFDGSGQEVARWHLADVHQPSGASLGPYPQDYSHANAVWVDASGDVLVSFRHLSAFVKVTGLHGAFGTLQWRLAGSAGSDLGTDFVLGNQTAGASDFLMQHNVHQRDDGRYAMLDNRIQINERSRIVILDVDPSVWRASILEAFDLPVHCDFQGSAWHTPAGHPVATCAPSRQVFEFDPDGAGLTDAPDHRVWEATADCGGGPSQYVPRIVPLDW